MNDFGAVIFCIAVLLGAYEFGGIMQKADIEYDCKNYHKTQIMGKWYTCKRLEPTE